jgi:hypothetical protein
VRGLPSSDQMVERVYDLVNLYRDESTRVQIARAAMLAAEYRAELLTKKKQSAEQKEKRT